jgi:hypothetical protein
MNLIKEPLSGRGEVFAESLCKLLAKVGQVRNGGAILDSIVLFAWVQYVFVFDSFSLRGFLLALLACATHALRCIVITGAGNGR